MSIIKALLTTGLLTSTMMRMASGVDQGMTLADFAEMETDDIKALDSLLFPQGVFGVRITQAQLGENPPKEGVDEKTGLPYPPLFFAEFKYEVLEASPLDKSIDAESLVGRMVTERFTFWPSNFKDQVGLLKGKYKKAGLANDGRVGGMEGGEPGWIDGAVDELIVLRVKHGKEDANGMRRVFFDWDKVPEHSESEAA